MIKVNNLSKEFHEQGTSNELLAVDHVDFTIQNGSFCALVGESGSGKSTLAQLMCGLLVPSSGEVLFEGKNISLFRGKQKQVLRSKIQLILQDGKGAMDPRFTVYQIIAEPIRNFRKLSKKEEEREINDLLTMMELPEEIKLRKAHELSGGQQKRVCIARALAAQPDVLIFDEAVSGLDVLVRKHAQGQIVIPVFVFRDQALHGIAHFQLLPHPAAGLMTGFIIIKTEQNGIELRHLFQHLQYRLNGCAATGYIAVPLPVLRIKGDEGQHIDGRFKHIQASACADIMEAVLPFL